MGRGRAKAKQAKVARELKYNSGNNTDLDRLRRELAGEKPQAPSAGTVSDDELDDEYVFDDDE